jgi:hypothetical protein
MMGKVHEITFEDMAQMIEGATKIPNAIIEGDEVIVPTEEIIRFRWAKIYDEWTIVEVITRMGDDILGPVRFYTIGSEMEYSPKDFEDFEWGDWIAHPDYGPFPNGIVLENKEK